MDYIPKYISYDSIVMQLNAWAISVVPYDDSTGGISETLIRKNMVDAESFVFNTILANYCESPLQTVDGLPFDTLALDPHTAPVYAGIISMMEKYTILLISLYYYASTGNEQGDAQITSAKSLYNQASYQYLQLDNATNPKLKNIFNGLKTVYNYSRRVPSGSKVPNMPTGNNQSWAAINSTPDFRY